MEALLRFKANDRCHSIPPSPLSSYHTSTSVHPKPFWLGGGRGVARPSNAAASAVSSPRRNKINLPSLLPPAGAAVIQDPSFLLSVEVGELPLPLLLLLQCVLRESVGTSKMDFPKDREEWGEQPPLSFYPADKNLRWWHSTCHFTFFFPFLGMFHTCEQASQGHPSP